MLNPSQADNADAVARFAKFERLSTSPGALKSLLRLNAQIDVKSILPALRVPTLVLHRRTDALVPVERGRELAAQIPGAKYVEYPDGDHLPFAGDTNALLGDIEEFITGYRESSPSDLQRVLATVLFTDIVGSTRVTVEIGDQAWHRLLDSHDQLAMQIVEQHRGILVRSTGDGILATFDGPGRAVRCALALGAASKQIGLPLRAGLHTGEIEIRGRDIGGIAVHAAARVMGQSQSNEVLVSLTSRTRNNFSRGAISGGLSRLTSANGMVRPRSSRLASDRIWLGAAKTRSAPCLSNPTTAQSP
jgi:class 3 adenylate cyclase